MNVLCPIDGSRYSEWALEWLPQVCFPSESSLCLLHVIDVKPFRTRVGEGKAITSAKQKAIALAESAGKKLLETATMKVGNRWSRREIKLLRGHPVEAISRVASRRGVDLVVIGSRGVGDFAPILAGSVSRKLVMHAPYPILVVKRRFKSLRRVMVATDGSKESWAALELLRLLPVPKKTRVTVVTVIPTLPFGSGLEPWQYSEVEEQVMGPLKEEAAKLVTQVAGVVRKAGFETDETVVQGNAAAEIIALAEAVRTDLIVVGSRGRSSSREYLIGSVTDSLVKHGPCSVLVFRQ